MSNYVSIKLEEKNYNLENFPETITTKDLSLHIQKTHQVPGKINTE